MGKSSIEWTNYTFNPWMGCTKVSEACKFCYAEKFTDRWGLAGWGDKAPRVKTSEGNWKKPMAWQRKAEKENTRYRVFCASLADVFEDHPTIQQQWRDQLFALIRNTPNLDWLLLTKRPENFKKFLPEDWGIGYMNVWLGITAENNKRYQERAPQLCMVSAAIRFISMEPLFEAINLSWLAVPEQIDWIIVGGESGFLKNARETRIYDIRRMLDQCRHHGIDFFMKQLGVKAAKKLKIQDYAGGNFDLYPPLLDEIKVRKIPISQLWRTTPLSKSEEKIIEQKHLEL